MVAVLFVDADRSFIASVEPSVARSGHRTFSAESADAAIEVMLNQRVDVLVTDLHLGQPDGLALIRMAKEVSPTTRAILMSANASARDYKAAIDLGAVDVLSKPFSAEELAQSVQKAVECEVGFRGSIHGLALSDILQMFHFARRSLVIQLGSERSVIHMENGEIVHAAAGDQRGVRALSLLLEHRAGSVRTLPPAPCERTIEGAFEPLLLDATRELDERKRTTGPATALAEDDELHLDALEREAPPPPPPRPSQLVPALPAAAGLGPRGSGVFRAGQPPAVPTWPPTTPERAAVPPGPRRRRRGLWALLAFTLAGAGGMVLWLWPRADRPAAPMPTKVAGGGGGAPAADDALGDRPLASGAATPDGEAARMTPATNPPRPAEDEIVSLTIKTLPPGLLLIDAATNRELGASPVTVRRAPDRRLTQVKARLDGRESPALGVAPDRDEVELDFRVWTSASSPEPGEPGAPAARPAAGARRRARGERASLAPGGTPAAAGPAAAPLAASPTSASAPARPQVGAVGTGGRPAIAPLTDRNAKRPTIGIMR